MLADIGLAALCDERIYWMVRPQNDPYPSVVLHLISNIPNYTYQGESALQFSRVQCDLYAESDMDGEALGIAFKKAVSGFRGIIGATDFKGIFIDGWRESVDAGKTESELLFRTSIDLTLNHKEA